MNTQIIYYADTLEVYATVTRGTYKEALRAAADNLPDDALCFVCDSNDACNALCNVLIETHNTIEL